MKYIITVSLFFMACGLASADDFPTSIEKIIPKEGFHGKLVRTYDPDYIVIELDSGELIDTTYSGTNSDKLDEWVDKKEKHGISREMAILYSNAEGVTAKDLKTGITFQLDGSMNPHPIDLAAVICEEAYSSTIGIQDCRRLQLKAWDAELNRAYMALGGSNNAKLKKSQLAWIKFRDAETEYLRSEYGKLEGSMWGNIFIRHEVNLTKEQVTRLQSVSSDF